MSKALLRFFMDEQIAYVGEFSEVNRIARLCQKWDNTFHVVQELFDDGLSFNNHCMSLYIRNDKRAWAAMEDLFRRTKEQGKTAKTIYRKEAYFRKGFWQILRNNPQLAEDEKAEAREKCEQFWLDSTLCSWWLQYYFDEFDPQLKVKVNMYPVNERYADIVRNVLDMEKRMNGNRKAPVLKVPTTKTELKVHGRDDCFLMFEWDDLSNAYEIMELLKQDGWQAGDKYFDWTKPLRKRINKMFPKARISTMSTPYNLYGTANNFFYIWFHWKPENFSWNQVRKAERAVRNLIFPRIKKFRPAKVKEKIS